MTTKNEQPHPWWASFIEKHGIATFILIAGGWYVTQTVVNPLVETARQFVSDIRECNVVIQDELQTANKQTMDRWNQLFDISVLKSGKIDDALKRLDEITKSHERLHNDIEIFRALLTRPESVEIRGMPKIEEKP